jgi:two-component system chemotaxis response regulator CheY
MVVDDDQGFREMVRDWLGDEGMPVVAEATDGARAVDLARKSSPDVILMDLSMPQLNGIEATRQIKAFLPTTQVIMLSGYGDVGLQRAAGDGGVDSYLEKGCSPELLWRTIRFAGTYKIGLNQRAEDETPPR